MPRLRARRGYVLLVVMWTIVTLGVAAAAASVSGRDAVGTASNRTELTRAAWLAEGCAAEVRAMMSLWLGEGDSAAARWDRADEAVTSRSMAQCDIALRPAGLRLDLNVASEGEIAQAVRALGVPGRRADALAAAITDWRDADDEVRPAGAEAAYYRAEHAVLPRNASFADISELRLVRGARDVPGLDSILAPDEGPVLLTRAPRAVIAGLPGITTELVDALLRSRTAGRGSDLGMVAGEVSTESRDALAAALPLLAERTTRAVSTWTLTATALGHDRHTTATVELRLARNRTRVVVVGRRVWP